MNLTWCILFFLAGWFSCVAGFEIAPLYGNLAAIASFTILLAIKHMQGEKEQRWP